MMEDKYDIVVIGGGTAGCACAYTAAQKGLKVLILEKNSFLGGTMTSSLVLPIMKSGENQINTKFYNQLVQQMRDIGGQVTYQGNSGWFNPELLKIVLDNMLASVGVSINFYSEVIKANYKNNHIYSINIKSTILSEHIDKIYVNKNNCRFKTLYPCIKARYFIDSTGFSNFSKLLSCEYIDDGNQTQPMNLRFIISGVNLEDFSKWLLSIDKDKNVTTVEKIDNQIHLSTAYTWDNTSNWALAPFFEDAVKKNILKDTDRNYFQVFTVAGMPGSLAFNCPRILKNIDLSDNKSTSEGIIEARRAILRIYKFCKIYFKGFDNSYISQIAKDLGVRVSPRIKAKYIYKTNDLIKSKTFKNPILISDYPIDIHSSKKDHSILKKNGEYQLPIESLISKDYDNLFTIGRAISAEFKAQAALRVQASCFSMGEGLANWLYKEINN